MQKIIKLNRPPTKLPTEEPLTNSEVALTNRMIKISEKLSKAFDFVRIDLYSLKDRIYFGEFTHYPESGRGLFTPKEFDDYLGSFWNLDMKKN